MFVLYFSFDRFSILIDMDSTSTVFMNLCLNCSVVDGKDKAAQCL